MLGSHESKADGSGVWAVPYGHNPFFTGRAKVLNDVRTALEHAPVVALTETGRLSSLDGVGKTQAAVAYVQRFQDRYQRVVWLRGESECTFLEDVLRLATLLATEEAGPEDWAGSIDAVRRRLAQEKDWLVVLDDLRAPQLMQGWVPNGARSHVLLTTSRETCTALGIEHTLELGEFPQEEAVRFLYKRTGRLDTDSAERKAATQLASTLGGFPLALELAGAFIAAEEIGVGEYLGRFEPHPAGDKPLSLGGKASGHAVARCLELTLDRIQQDSPSAIELLRAIAWVDLDHIPLDGLSEGPDGFGPLLVPVLSITPVNQEALEPLLKPLARYGLIRLDQGKKGLSIHRTIRSMVRKGLTEQEHDLWRDRVIDLASRALSPRNGEGPPATPRVLPTMHMALRAAYNATGLPVEFGHRLRECALLTQEQAGLSFAQGLFESSLAVLEAALGADDLDVAGWWHDLGDRYAAEERKADADRCYTRSLATREARLGRHHADLASYLDTLATCYDRMGEQTSADTCFSRALNIREQTLGAAHPDLATYVHSVGRRYAGASRHREAEEYLTRALHLLEEAFGRVHIEVAGCLHDLACEYVEQGRGQEAEPHFKRALAMAKQLLPAGDPSLATYLHSLARYYHTTKKYKLAEPLYADALTLRERAHDPGLAVSLNNLAAFYHEQRKYTKAEPLLKRALALVKRFLPADHPDLAICLNNLGALFVARRKYVEAEPLYERALAIKEKHLPSDDPELLTTLDNYAGLLRKLKRAKEATSVGARAAAIRAGVAHQQIPTSEPPTASVRS